MSNHLECRFGAGPEPDCRSWVAIGGALLRFQGDRVVGGRRPLPPSDRPHPQQHGGSGRQRHRRAHPGALIAQAVPHGLSITKRHVPST